MCCGKNSTRLPTNSESQFAPPRPSMTANLRHSSTFEYVGRTAATVIGPVSGAVYRFGGPGSRRQVDPRDRPGLAYVPVLRFVR
jgi:hypothetical protein